MPELKLNKLKEIPGCYIVTAQIVCCMPDRPDNPETLVWQGYDFSKECPELNRFIEFLGDRRGAVTQVQSAEIMGITGPPDIRENNNGPCYIPVSYYHTKPH